MQGLFTDHNESSSTPTEPAGLAVAVRIMQVEVVVNLAPDEVCYSIEVLNAPGSIAVTGGLLQIAECSLMLPPQLHFMRSQSACKWPNAHTPSISS